MILLNFFRNKLKNITIPFSYFYNITYLCFSYLLKLFIYNHISFEAKNLRRTLNILYYS